MNRFLIALLLVAVPVVAFAGGDDEDTPAPKKSECISPTKVAKEMDAKAVKLAAPQAMAAVGYALRAFDASHADASDKASAIGKSDSAWLMADVDGKGGSIIAWANGKCTTVLMPATAAFSAFLTASAKSDEGDD